MLRLLLLACCVLSGCFARSGRVLPAVHHSRGVSPDVADALGAALAKTRAEIGAPAATQVVLQGDHRWAAATGWAERNTRLARVDDAFRIGSITKTYTAAALVSLHVEGALSLDDPASKWVPEAPHGDRYTLRQVLAHQTGLEDFVRTPRFALRLDRQESMRELLAYVEDEPLAFEPGTASSYSNTNYLIAGLAIEAVTGLPWGEVVKRRFIEPLDLDATWIPSIEPEPVDIVRGYVGPFDVTQRFEPSRASAGGEIVATADDVARFVQALFFGELVHPRVLELMTTEQRTSAGEPTGRGLGLSITESPHGLLFGHSGSIVSFQSRFHVHRPSRTVVVSLASSFFAEADDLDASAWDVLARSGRLDARPAVGAEALAAKRRAVGE